MLKDVPDARGTGAFASARSPVGGPDAAFGWAWPRVVGYLAMAVAGPLLVNDASPWLLAVGHLACLAVLLTLAARVDPGDPAGFTRFYMRVWALFFVEYLLVPAAVVVGS